MNYACITEALQTHLALKELFNISTVRLRVSGDIDRAGRGLLNPQLDSPADLCQVRKAHVHGERQGFLPVVANTLRRRHEVRTCITTLQHFASILLLGEIYKKM